MILALNGSGVSNLVHVHILKILFSVERVINVAGTVYFFCYFILLMILVIIILFK